MTSADSDSYQGAFPVDVQVGNAQLRVTVHFALVDAQLTCVGFDVRSFTSPSGFEPPEDWRQIVPIGGEWTRITSPLLRGVPTAKSIEQAFGSARKLATQIFEDLPFLQDDAEGWFGMFEGEQPKRRGAKRILDDETLRDVVARAYRSAPTRPVQAVKRAMEEASIPAYKGGEISPDVARKAVAAARARGFIPPAKKSNARKRSSHE